MRMVIPPVVSDHGNRSRKSASGISALCADVLTEHSRATNDAITLVVNQARACGVHTFSSMADERAKQDESTAGASTGDIRPSSGETAIPEETREQVVDDALVEDRFEASDN